MLRIIGKIFYKLGYHLVPKTFPEQLLKEAVEWESLALKYKNSPSGEYFRGKANAYRDIEAKMFWINR